MGTCVSVFLNLAKSGHLRIPKQLFCSKIIKFWDFGQKISEKTHFIILRIISWLSGAYAEEVFQNQRICQFLNKIIKISIFGISFEEHF